MNSETAKLILDYSTASYILICIIIYQETDNYFQRIYKEVLACKVLKLPSQHTVMGRYRPISETPFEWRFTGGPIVAHFNMATGFYLFFSKEHVLWFCIVIAYQVNVLHAEIFFPFFVIIWIYPKLTFFEKHQFKEYHKRAEQFESRSSPTDIQDYFLHVAIFFQLTIFKINFFRKTL